MLRSLEIIKDRLRENGYHKVQYLPTRKSMAMGKELYVFKSFFYQKAPCLFHSTCFYTLYHLIFRGRNPRAYRLYKIFFMDEPVDREFLLTLFSAEEIDGLIRKGIINQKGQEYAFNFRFVPFEGLLLVAKIDMEDPEYAHVNYDSVTFVEFLRGAHLKKGFKRALEIGCGAGLISMEIAKVADSVDAVDLNPHAAKVMDINARLNGVPNINAFVSDCYQNLSGRYDLIVSDPPFEVMPEEEKNVLHRYGGFLGMEIALKIFKGLDDHLTETGEAIVFTNSYIRNFRINSLMDALRDIFKDKGFKITFHELSYQITPEFYPIYRRYDINYSIGYVISVKRAPDLEIAVVPLGFFKRIKEMLRLFYLRTIILLKRY